MILKTYYFKKLILSAFILIIILFTGIAVKAAEASPRHNTNDEAALTEILTAHPEIAELCTVWNDDGRLVSFSAYDITGAFDASKLDYLETLSIYQNKLTSINVTGLNRLKKLCINGARYSDEFPDPFQSTNFNSPLAVLDINGLTSLEVLFVARNNLESLYITNCEKLVKLDASWNNLSDDIQITDCPSLETLDLSNNRIIQLNLDQFDKLKNVNISCNQLTSFTINSLDKLTNLNCSYNELTRLDVRNCNNLERIYCYKNALTSLNVKSLDKLLYLDCRENLLSELKVSSEIIRLYVDQNKLTKLFVPNSVQYLTCSQNKLAKLDLSSTKKIKILDCSNNKLKTLNISSLTKLKNLKCFGNQLKTLNLKKNKEVTFLALHGNEIKKLDITMLPRNITLYCDNKVTVKKQNAQKVSGEKITFFYNGKLKDGMTLTFKKGQRIAIGRYNYSLTEEISENEFKSYYNSTTDVLWILFNKKGTYTFEIYDHSYRSVIGTRKTFQSIGTLKVIVK